MNWREYLKKNALFVSVCLLIGIIVIVVVGCLLSPSIFYDNWIWKYYWGPVVSDATGHTVTYNGVAANEGYTLVSEITYGIILIGALYGIYQLLKKLKVSIDWWFCLALMPYILFGPVTRVLEDTNYFSVPSVYFFISPFIYFQIAVYALVFLFLGISIQKQSVKKQIISSVLLFCVFDFVYVLLWLGDVSFGLPRIDPFVFVVISLFAFIPLVYMFVKKHCCTLNTVLFSGGLLFLLPSLYLIGRWIVGDQWSYSAGVRFDILLLIVGCVAAIAFGVYLVSKTFSKKQALAVYRKPLNLCMIVGHLVDGLTSYISIYDPFHMGLPLYEEKHPVSNLLLDVWPPLFPIIKLLMILMVIAFFDILYKKELKHYGRLVNLLKIGIIILGLSPGLRDLLRVVMGV
ncbi:MAG: DUF63 family protein [Euryarchaeota archaeon]|nr:DUF63 family protein [Euryarchaeota archaeon]